MKSDLMSKLSASFFVLVMALSTLVVVLPDSTEGQTSGTNVVYVPVVDQTLQKVTTATVTLTNVHSGASLRATYNSGILFSASPPSGFYRVDVTATGYYDALNAAYFRWDTLSNLTTSIVQLTAFPTKIYTWNITVTPAIAGIQVGFYDATNRQIVASATTGTFGFAIVSMFDTTSLPATFYIFAKASGYETYLAVQAVSSSGSKAITLTAASQVIGLVKSPTGLGQNVVAYLLNDDPSIPWIKRLLKSNAATGSFGFDAYPGTYTLAVKADGLQSNITTLDVAGNTILDMTLPTQTPRLEQTSIAYDANYHSFNLSLATTWGYDEPFPGMQFSDVGSLRMQIDLNNNSDGTVDALEDANFRTFVLNFGAKNVTTSWLLSVNQTATSPGVLYLAAPGLANFNLGSTVGSVTLTTGVAYSYRATYTMIVPSGVTAPPVTSPIYTMAMNINHDTPFINYAYSVALMPDFELVLNTTSDSATFVGGYETFTLNPALGLGPVNVHLTVEKAKAPVAKGGLDSSASVYVYKNATNVVIRYYVRVGSNATFTANSSSDPNGNPLSYFWEFGDGTNATTKNKTLVHVYSSASASRVATLTVTDVSGLTNSASINITCDDLDPRPVITLKNRTLIGGTLYLKQGESFVINATGSEDDAATDRDSAGRIDHIQFSWGDGNLSGRIAWTDNQKNSTKSYAAAGNYTLWLNVTDVVGHHKNVSMPVHVNDTTAPTVSYIVRNGTWSTTGTTLVEGQVLHFVASATRDNVNNYTKLKYDWSFGDGKYNNWSAENTGNFNVTHTYEKLGTYTVSLNVTDLSGNYLKVPKIITVSSKPRPNLRIDNASYQPNEFTEGKSGTIVVNITNVGDSVATGITVDFYIQMPDGTQKKLVGTMTVYNGTNAVTQVAAGGKIQVKFVYTPSGSGTFTLTVNATSTDQLENDVVVQSGPNALVVHQAAWKAYALWGGVIGVIILVPLLILLTRRWSRRERKGPRREKKSEEE